LLIFRDDPLDVQEFGSGKTMASHQNNRMDPELRTAALSFDMHMGCFSSVG
jgi:hypothetical protein